MVAWLSESLRDAGSSAQVLAWTAADKNAPLITQLDPPSRTKVIMALVGFTLLGMALLSLVVLLGRRARRLARQSQGKTHTGHDDWFRKPLARDDSEESPTRNS